MSFSYDITNSPSCSLPFLTRIVFSRDGGRYSPGAAHARSRLGEASGDIPGDMVRGVEEGEALRSLGVNSLDTIWSEDDDMELSWLSDFRCRTCVRNCDYEIHKINCI